MPVAVLGDRGVARVAGGEARAFLQGLVTCDMDKVAPGKAAFGALLTPQGKIIVDFIVTEAERAFWLDCPAALVTDLVRKLRLYRLRARVEIEDVSATHAVVASWGPETRGAPDPRDGRLGAREILVREGLREDPAAMAAHEALRIRLGVPRGGVDFVYGDAFPHEANMDLLHGVDFKKGCYVGQEVVSRVEHRGTARKRVARVTFAGAAPMPGAPLMAGEIDVGVMGSAIEGAGLAMVRVDRVADAGAPVTVDGRAVALVLPARGG
jgi:folate-binding protein YgfZ